MSLSQNIAEEMKAAMKAKDKVRLEALRSIKSAILLANTEKGGGSDLSEADELKLLQRLQKQRKDSLEIYEQQGREDLAKEEREQLEVIEGFLPKQMDEAELKAYLQELVDRLDAKGPQDMGKVMSAASKELAGKADGKTISVLVKDILK
ncbi:MAG: GatB/YqeY domain-containing protein [Owenweeksia sp.]